MAEPAGKVNDRGVSHRADFDGIIDASSDEVREVAVAVRDLVYDVFPKTIEVVWPRQGSVGWGIGPKKFTEQFAYLMPYKKHVTLGFYHGGELPDSHGLLPTKGGRQVGGTLSMRSLKLSSVAEVGRPELRALIKAATEAF